MGVCETVLLMCNKYPYCFVEIGVRKTPYFTGDIGMAADCN